MRKLKLQMQVSVDGFVAGPNGEMDWMTWNWDDRVKEHVDGLTRLVDLIVLGRKLAEGFIPAWESRLVDADPATADFARKMTDPAKVVFSRTLHESPWQNTVVANGDLSEEMRRLKAASASDIIAYGGGEFVSELIRHGLIDEYHFFINPAAIGAGMSIFREPAKAPMKLIAAESFDCGIVAVTYAPVS